MPKGHEMRFKQTSNNLGSVMTHTFSQVPKADIPRSSFNRSHCHKTTFNEGELIPIFVDEVLPGDTMKMDATFFARLATPIYPIMDNLYLDSFWFYVPYRLLWENFEKQQGQQTNPGDSTDFVDPQIQITGAAASVGSIFDYMGTVVPVGQSIHVDSAPYRAYNLIYNYWFRDENLIDSLVNETDDGPDSLAYYAIRRRGKRHDYFTSCLPWPQKGDAVTLPLGGTAPVVFPSGISVGNANDYTVGTPIGTIQYDPLAVPTTVNLTSPLTTPTGPHLIDFYGSGPSDAYTNLAAATAATINSIRYAFQMQKLLERDARGGTRFPEILLSHFGVTSPDSRVQWPEYLGGGETIVNIHPVANTAGVSGAPVQGNLAAFGTAVSHRGHNHGFTKSFVEHGWLIGLVSVRADLTYQQGIERMWFRQTRFDRYWPVFAHLGEQAVLNREIYATGVSSDTEVFGYQEAWAEYRYKPSRISGLFRSTYTDPLDAWHLSQKFTSLPVLGQTFIEENAPMSRIEAVTNQFDFIFDSFFNYTCARPMPVYSVPGLIDHF